ncbi:MAG: hypothetical protein V8S24_04440 [Gordonibacter pamelaeae]
MKTAAITAGAAAALGAQTTTAFAESTYPEVIGNDTVAVKTCCRGCGKMECGVKVVVQNGRAIRVEGDEGAWQSMGNCCTKSQSSIQAAYHPDRLHYPMKRTNPKGDEPGWVRITWDEALDTIVRQDEGDPGQVRRRGHRAARSARPVSGACTPSPF